MLVHLKYLTRLNIREYLRQFELVSRPSLLCVLWRANTNLQVINICLGEPALFTIDRIRTFFPDGPGVLWEVSAQYLSVLSVSVRAMPPMQRWSKSCWNVALGQESNGIPQVSDMVYNLKTWFSKSCLIAGGLNKSLVLCVFLPGFIQSNLLRELVVHLLISSLLFSPPFIFLSHHDRKCCCCCFYVLHRIVNLLLCIKWKIFHSK